MKGVIWAMAKKIIHIIYIENVDEWFKIIYIDVGVIFLGAFVPFLKKCTIAVLINVPWKMILNLNLSITFPHMENRSQRKTKVDVNMGKDASYG